MRGADSRAIIAGSFVLVLLIGYLDFITGPAVSLTLFYLGPVVGAAWFGGRFAGIAAALVSGVASLSSDLALPASNTTATFLWNSLSRTVILAIAALVVDRVRSDRQLLQTINAQRTRSLRLLDRGLSVPARELLDLADHWDGSVDQLRAMLRPRAETIAFLARDFTEMVLLQRGQLPFTREKLDLVSLMEDFRAGELTDRRVTFVAPTERMYVSADANRLRQSIAALVGVIERTEELFVTLKRGERTAELVISADGASVRSERVANPDEVSLTVELARLMFAAQGGSLEVVRNPITKRLRATAQIPLA